MDEVGGKVNISFALTSEELVVMVTLCKANLGKCPEVYMACTYITTRVLK